jgi:hypothetical protein
MGQETDVQPVARIYAEIIRQRKSDLPAREAATAAWHERHPDVSDKDADLTVARPICRRAISAWCGAGLAAALPPVPRIPL